MASVPVTKMEFAVRMECPSCETDVRSVLQGVEGVINSYVDVDNDLVLVDTVLPSGRVQELLERTGKLVVCRGIGNPNGNSTSGYSMQAGVAIFRGGEVNGLVRLVQMDEQCCVVEGTIDGFGTGMYQLQVCEYGDLSQGYLSCGNVFRHANEVPAVGDLGKVQADSCGRIQFRIISKSLQVRNVIGRSLTLLNPETQRQFCSIIARSAGLFQNIKKVCTCDGTTLWDEATKPLPKHMM